MPQRLPRSYAAAAVGKSRNFAVELDEALDDPDEMRLQLRTRAWFLELELASRDTVNRMLAFFKEYSGLAAHAEITIGFLHNVPLKLVKDDEFTDRFWLRTHADHQMVEFTVTSNELPGLTDALAQAAREL